MKKLTLLFVVIAVASIACDAGESKETINTGALTKGLWVKLDSEWQPSPAESGFTSSAYARVLRFASDGQFSWIACMLLRTRERTVISPGDGQVFFFGKWEAVGDRAQVEYVKAREMIHVAGSDQPFEKKRTATAEITGDTLIFEGLRFTRSFAPDQKAYDAMVNGVRTWEAQKLRSFFGKE